MRSTINEIIALQGSYSDQNTPAMEKRGTLIRNTLPREIITFASDLKLALQDYGIDADVEGRDGTGRKTRIPWVRWYSVARSPSAQQGWYIVLLFHPDGTGVSLCLSHGSTTLQNGSYVSRSDAEAAELITWAETVVASEFASDNTVRRGVSLGSYELAKAYEKTTVYSKFYSANAVPEDEDLRQDLVRFCEPLRKLYRAQELGLASGEAHIDVVAISEEIAKFTAPARAQKPGQGRGLSAPLRKAIELHAMGEARKWMKAQGFSFTDVSASDSCDFRAQRNGEEWVIEVKGTTGGPGSILLTKNEIALHRKSFPRNALLIVHGLVLEIATAKVSGGEMVAITPWELDEERLQAICYEYRI